MRIDPIHERSRLLTACEAQEVENEIRYITDMFLARKLTFGSEHSQNDITLCDFFDDFVNSAAFHDSMTCLANDEYKQSKQKMFRECLDFVSNIFLDCDYSDIHRIDALEDMPF